MIDINKKYKTRSRLPVRILCTDRNDDNYNVVALVSISGTYDRLNLYTANGKYFSDGELAHYMDLVEVPSIKVGDLVMCWDSWQEPSEAHHRKYGGVSEQGYHQDSNKCIWANCMPLEDYVKEFM